MNTGQIIRSKSTDKYVSIPNTIAQGKDLTLGERGLMLYLLSLPSDWVVNKSNLHELVNEKKGTVDGIFKGLQLKGFIVSAKVVDENGRFKGWNHIVYDEPILPDSKNYRNRFLPKSETTDIGKSTPIQNTNLKGLQITKDITKGENENFEKEIPSFVEADRQKAREFAEASKQVSIEELTAQLKADTATIELLCMNHKIKPIELDAAINHFKNYLTITGKQHNRVEFRSHFANWLPKNLDKAKVVVNTPSKPKYKNESVPQYIKDQITGNYGD